MQKWLFLTLAIVAEVIGTSFIKAADGFTRPGPSLLVVLSYAVAFYFLSLTVRLMPVGVVYAIWSGLGTALIAAVGWWVFGQKLDAAAIVGLLMIVGGVVVLNTLSTTLHH